MFINIKCIYYYLVHKRLKKIKKNNHTLAYFINGYCSDDNCLRPKMLSTVNWFLIKYCELNVFLIFYVAIKINVISKIKIHDCL